MVTPQQTVNDPALFAGTFLKILNKNQELVPFHWNKAQAHFHKNRTGRDLILKARQLGFSTYAQGEMFRRTVTSSRSTITLAHDSDTTQKLRFMANRFYDNCKFNNIQPARQYANASLTTYPEFDSAATIATAGSLETGRGGTYTDFHGSEVAFWKDALKIINGAMQGGNPEIILESTPNGAQGAFYDLCMEALRGQGVWTCHFYSWWWEDGYKIPLADGEQLSYTADEIKLMTRHNLTAEQIKWRRNKQAELRDFFKQEYPEDPISCFLTSGHSYFGDTSLFFTAPLNSIYNPNHEYYAGLDFGQTNDFTAMPVIDKNTKQQVDLLYINKLEWEEQRRRIKIMYNKWHCQAVTAEWNSIGGPNIEALRRDGLNVARFTTTAMSKSNIMANLYEGLHTDGLRLQDIGAQRHELNTFVSSQTTNGVWRMAAEGSGHDDTVIALALAWHSCYSSVTESELKSYSVGEIPTDDELSADMLEYMEQSGLVVKKKARE